MGRTGIKDEELFAWSPWSRQRSSRSYSWSSDWTGTPPLCQSVHWLWRTSGGRDQCWWTRPIVCGPGDKISSLISRLQWTVQKTGQNFCSFGIIDNNVSTICRMFQFPYLHFGQSSQLLCRALLICWQMGLFSQLNCHILLILHFMLTCFYSRWCHCRMTWTGWGCPSRRPRAARWPLSSPPAICDDKMIR